MSTASYKKILFQVECPTMKKKWGTNTIPLDWFAQDDAISKSHPEIDKKNAEESEKKRKKAFVVEWGPWTQKDHDQLVEIVNRKIRAPNGEEYDDYINDGMNDHKDSLDRKLEDEEK